MKNCSVLVGSFVPVLALILITSTDSLRAEKESSHVFIQAVEGDATYSTGGQWQPLSAAMTLTAGSKIKTGANATVDLILRYNGTVLRLTPNSELRFVVLSVRDVTPALYLS